MNSFNSPKQGSMLPCSNQSIQNTVKTVLFIIFINSIIFICVQKTMTKPDYEAMTQIRRKSRCLRRQNQDKTKTKSRKESQDARKKSMATSKKIVFCATIP
ncbi:MAG: hypothetical protein EAZ92_07180 [Candidatus Kapaibacterium sp.]|nr:MAG: hypothetical protein EAZ92_07180 [Candidatus Kapabacteria bacterium]